MKSKWIALSLLILLLCFIAEYIYIHKPQEIKINNDIVVVKPTQNPKSNIYKIPNKNNEYTKSTSQRLSDHLSSNSVDNNNENAGEINKDRRTTKKVKEEIIKDQYLNVSKEITF